MYEPSSAGVTVVGSSLATRRPRSITSSVSDNPISSSRSAETSSTARPAARASRSWSQMAAWAPTSTPRVGWAAMSTIGSAIISRPTISFCWLPPDSARAATSVPGRADVELLDDLLGALARRRPVDPGPRHEGRLRLVAEHHVLPERRVEHQPVAVAVLGDVAEPVLAAVAGAELGDVACPRARSCRSSGGSMPMIASISSVWPLPSTPAMPTISPRWTLEVDVARARARPRLSTRHVRRARAPRRRSPAARRGLGRGQLAADHQLGQLAGGHVLRAAPRRRCGRRG